jgi:protein-disulfide isomerase
MNKAANANISGHDHVLGPDNADVTIVEYADYQCPYSGRAHNALKDLGERLGLTLRLVYRHFPLMDVHEYAEMASEAAEAAAAQGKFWQMHNALYAHQERLSPDILPVLAESIDLDIDRFTSDMLERRYRQRVLADVERGREDGADSTPTFFFNGERYYGDSDEQSLAQAIRDAAK